MNKLLFIPCYNDLDCLKKLLNEIDESYSSDFDILVINDGSKQKFFYSLKKINLKIINLKNNFGVGFCLKFAINYAIKNNYSKFCRIDSDGEHNPKYIKQFFSSLDDSDFIFGKRIILYNENFLKILSKKFINFIINNLFHFKFQDYNCGMMGFNSKIMRQIQNQYFINYPEPQIILKLCKKKIKFSIIEIEQRIRITGNSSISLLRGLDFILVTLFFIINNILNKNND